MIPGIAVLLRVNFITLIYSMDTVQFFGVVNIVPLVLRECPKCLTAMTMPTPPIPPTFCVSPTYTPTRFILWITLTSSSVSYILQHRSIDTNLV